MNMSHIEVNNDNTNNANMGSSNRNINHEVITIIPALN